MIPPNINKEDVLVAIKRIDNEGIPTGRHSVRWSVEFEGSKYPPKYIVSLANISANGEELHPSNFSGGDETNEYLKELGFEIVVGSSRVIEYPYTSHSWTLISDKIASKALDKSSFLHHGSAIPHEIKSFFGVGDLAQDQKEYTKLVYRGQEYDAHFQLDPLLKRVRLFWKSDFSGLLQETFPKWYSIYSENNEPDTEPPIIKLTKRDGTKTTYKIDFIEKNKNKRNPKWVRDELILALDLYFRCPPQNTGQDNPEIIALSEALNSLPIHPRKSENETFRNPNGVYMKMCNFLRFDPKYDGVGLKAGGKLEEKIWNEFYKNQDKLREIANAIHENAVEIPRPTVGEIEDEEFEEGRILTKTHKVRERSPAISAKKKLSVMKKTGKLICEACGFDFEEKYGEIGKGFAECHHTKPLSGLKKGEKTKLKDLSILCSNCHSIIHKTKPMVSVHELRTMILD